MKQMKRSGLILFLLTGLFSLSIISDRTRPVSHSKSFAATGTVAGVRESSPALGSLEAPPVGHASLLLGQKRLSLRRSLAPEIKLTSFRLGGPPLLCLAKPLSADVSLTVNFDPNLLGPAGVVLTSEEVQLDGIASAYGITDRCVAMGGTLDSVSAFFTQIPTTSALRDTDLNVSQMGERVRIRFTPDVPGEYKVVMQALGVIGGQVVFGEAEVGMTAVALNGWASIGPDNIAGRLTGIVVDSSNTDTLYVNAATGGVWESTDAGSSWRPLTDEQPTMISEALGFDPGPPFTLYVGTYNYGNPAIGVLKGVRQPDGTFIWTTLSTLGVSTDPNNLIQKDLLKGRNIYKVLVYPTLPPTLYVATGGEGWPPKAPSPGDGIFKSVIVRVPTKQGGLRSELRWVKLTAGLPEQGNVDVRNLIVDASTINPSSTTNATLYAGVMGYGVFKSTDGGTTWTNKSQGLPSLLPPIDDGFQLVIGCFSKDLCPDSKTLYAGLNLGNGDVGLFRSTDAAESWKPVDLNLNASGKVSLGCTGNKFFHLALVPNDPLTLYVAALYDVWKVQVGNPNPATWSATWTNVHDCSKVGQDRRVIGFSPNWGNPAKSEPKTIYLGTDGGLYICRDGLACGRDDWKNSNHNLVTSQFYHFGLAPEFSRRVAGGLQDNGTLCRGDAKTWAIIAGADGSWSQFDAGTKLIEYHNGGNYDGIYRQRFSGTLCESVTNEFIGNGRAGEFFIADPFRPGVLVSLSNSVCSGGTVCRSTDADSATPATWQAIDPKNKTGGPTAFAFARPQAASDPASIYYLGTSSGQLWRGKGSPTSPPSWDLTPIFTCGAGIGVIAIDPTAADPDTLYVTCPGATDSFTHTPAAVFKLAKTTGGYIPTNITGNLPAELLSSVRLAVDPLTANTVYAGTNVSLYKGQETASGWRWVREPSMPNTQITGLITHPKEKGMIRASTYGRGIFEIVRRRPASPIIVNDQITDLQAEELPGSEGSHRTIRLRVNYAYLSDHGDHVTLRAVLLQNGQPSDLFVVQEKPLQRGFGTTSLIVDYAGSQVPPGIVTDAIRLEMVKAGATVQPSPFFTTTLPLSKVWRRDGGQILSVTASQRGADGIISPLSIPVTMTPPSGGSSKQTDFEAVLQRGTAVSLQALARIQTDVGLLNFIGWEIAGKTIQSSQVISITLNEDTAVTARYELNLPLNVSITSAKIAPSDPTGFIRQLEVAWVITGGTRPFRAKIEVTIAGQTQMQLFDHPQGSATSGAVSFVFRATSGDVIGITVTVTDAMGDRAIATTQTTVGPAPVLRISCPSDIVQTAPLGQNFALVNYPKPMASIQGTTVICTPPSGSSFSVGKTSVVCFAAGAADNTATCTFSVVVEKAKEPLTLNCPGDVAVVAPMGQGTGTVNYPPPTVTPPGATVICLPPSGSSFPIGIVAVSCTATDNSGNTASCAFNVRVRGQTGFDLCLQDDSSHDTILINSANGDYQFKACSSGVTVTGRGSVNQKDRMVTLTDNQLDRRVVVTFDSSQNLGTASVQIFSPPATYTIINRDAARNSCACP